MLSEAFLDELRNRVPVSAVVARRVKLTRAGREHKGLCPFHNEKTPSFTVNDDKGFYHCFSCGAHGDVIGFEMRAGHLPFTDAVERLAADAGLEMPRVSEEDRQDEVRRATLYEASEAACTFFEGELWKPSGRAGLDYLLGRGLDEETIRRFRLGWAPGGDGMKRALMGSRFPESLLLEAGLLHQRDGGGTGDLFRGRVTFAIADRRGRVIAFGARALGDAKPKYINTPATPIFDKGANLYGLAHAREAMGKTNRALVVEGYMDVIALHRAGLTEAVAPLGTAFTERQMQGLWRLAPSVVLCLDGDAAGQKAMAKAAERAVPEMQPGKTLSFAVLPTGEDPDSLIRSAGADSMAAVLDGARDLVDVLWDMARAGRRMDVPEGVAALEGWLYRLAAGIKDAAVRRLYLAEFRRRLRWAAEIDPPAVMIGRSTRQTAPRPYRGRLAAEWEEALALGQSDGKFHAWLERNGIAWDAVSAALGGLGIVQAKPVKGRWAEGEQWALVEPPALWDPVEEGGQKMAVIPAWEGGIVGGALVDLIGWTLRGGELMQRAGLGAVLGGDVLDEALAFEAAAMRRPLRVAASPLSWLRKVAAGDPAVLVVDWRRAWDALGGLAELEAETDELGRQLVAMVRPPPLPRPKVFSLEGA